MPMNITVFKQAGPKLGLTVCARKGAFPSTNQKNKIINLHTNIDIRFWFSHFLRDVTGHRLTPHLKICKTCLGSVFSESHHVTKQTCPSISTIYGPERWMISQCHSQSLHLYASSLRTERDMYDRDGLHAKYPDRVHYTRSDLHVQRSTKMQRRPYGREPRPCQLRTYIQPLLSSYKPLWTFRT